MKDKIAQALKTKYASFGLSNEALDGVASIIEKTVKEEADIANAIAGAEVEGLIKVFQKDVDKYRNAKSQLDKDFEEYKKKHPDTNPNNPPTTPSEPDDANAKAIEELKAKFEAQEAKLAAREKAVADKELIAKVRTALESDGCENKGILNLVFANASVADGDTEDTLKEKYKSAYNTAYKDTFGEGAVPPASHRAHEGYKQGDFADMNKMLESEGLLPKQE